MSRTIFSICSMSALSAHQAAPKRCREECNKKQEIVAKSKPTLNLVSRSAASSPAAPSSSASRNLITQRAGKPAAGGSNQNDAALSSQVLADKCTVERMCEETRCCRHEPRVRFFKNVQGNLPLKNWTSRTRTTRSDRTISAYLELTYHTLRKSTRP